MEIKQFIIFSHAALHPAHARKSASKAGTLCVCVCARARARVRVCVRVYVCMRVCVCGYIAAKKKY
jgi:hypothetical protein